MALWVLERKFGTWEGPPGAVEGKPRAECLGWEPAVGESWADNGLIKERVWAGRSRAWPQLRGEEVVDCSFSP